MELSKVTKAAGLIVLLLAVSACATKQDVRYRGADTEIAVLTRDAREAQALQEFAATYPDLADKDGMSAFLGSFRSAQRRAHALKVQFRHQYPRATEQELTLLVDDQMAREGATMFAMPPASSTGLGLQGIDCTSLRLQNMTHTSCY